MYVDKVKCSELGMILNLVMIIFDVMVVEVDVICG